MKNIAIALAALIAFAAPVKAADMFTPDTADYEAPVYAFTGFGLGIDGGGQFNAWDVNAEDCEEGECVPLFDFDGISSDGLLIGAHLEYLFAVERFRLGAYGEGGFSNVNTSLDVQGEGGFSEDLLTQDSYYGAGLKAGVTVYGGTLLYGRFGYDWSQWTAREPAEDGFVDIDADVGSWLIGGGIDTMIADRWSLGLGVDYLIVDDVDAAGADLSDILGDSEMIRAKVRLTYRQ